MRLLVGFITQDARFSLSAGGVVHVCNRCHHGGGGAFLQNTFMKANASTVAAAHCIHCIMYGQGQATIFFAMQFLFFKTP
jgi:hypothetical protein